MNMLTKQQILLLHSQLIRQSGGSDGIRYEGMLDSAINQPFQTFDGIELYPSIVDKAIRLGYGLITNHPFIDGNKRIGTHALLVTLDINGIELQYFLCKGKCAAICVCVSQIHCYCHTLTSFLML